MNPDTALVEIVFVSGPYDGLTERKPAPAIEPRLKLPISRAFIAATARKMWGGKPKITGYAWYSLSWRPDGSARYLYRGRTAT